MNTLFKICFAVLATLSLTACVGGPGYGYGYPNHIPTNAFNTGKACGGAERVMQDADSFIKLGSNNGDGLERKRTSVDTNENHGRVRYNCNGHADGNSTNFQGQEIPPGAMRRSPYGRSGYSSGYNRYNQGYNQYNRGIPYSHSTGGSVRAGAQYELRTYPPNG